jgi:hypothetical protein
MAIAAALDEIPKPVWLALMVLGFIFFWPLGLMILGYLLWSGRMGCWRHAGTGWHGHMTGRWHGMRQSGGPSGNTAFDEYRAETLRRLEDEEREFRSFLDRLRRARDKAEFDQFLAERRNASSQPPQAQE